MGRRTYKVIAQETKGWQMEMNKLSPQSRNNRKRVLHKRIRRKLKGETNV